MPKARKTCSLSPVLGGEGRGEGRAMLIVHVAMPFVEREHIAPLPNLSPEYRGEGTRRAVVARVSSIAAMFLRKLAISNFSTHRIRVALTLAAIALAVS